MAILNIRHWFHKRESALSSAEVGREQMSRFNARLKSDPKDLTNAITCFDSGNLGPLARLVEEYERRDDKMKTCSMKMKASVGRCDYSIQKREGFEDDPRAERHADILKRFWSTVRTTSTFKRNETGGFNLLKKQMMDAQSYGFAVHELVWTPTSDGELRAEFIQVPLWHFENRTGRLRFLPTPMHYIGTDMNPGEWMVTTGDGVGIAASLCACMKRMGLVDWMIYNERCGMPLLHGSTGAAFESDQWKNLNSAIRNIARYTQILTDTSTKIEAIPLGGGASIPYPQLIEWCDRAIASLYRGADLSTMSQGGEGVGASLQGDESDMLEQDACGRLSDTLNEAVDRFVIRYVTGDDEPLARIVVEPMSKPNVDTEIKIDSHLVSLGVKLSKNDALQRYGRTEADPNDPEDAALQQPQQSMQGSFGGFANESAGIPSHSSQPSRESQDVLNAFARDTGPAAEAIKDLLKNPSKEAADELLKNLPTLLPEDPALAAVIAEEMAKQFTDPAGQSLEAGRHTDSQDSQSLTNEARDTGYLVGANDEDIVAFANENGECESDDPPHCRVHGTPETRPISEQLAELGYKDKNDVYSKADVVSKDRVEQIVSGKLKEHCSVHEAVAALRTNPTVTNAFGKKVTFGDDMIIHYLGGYGRSNNQPDAKRLKELPMAMHAVINCRNPRLQYPKGVTPDPMNPPRGTQYVYHEKVGNGDMQCRAWVDTGKVKGWFVK